MDWVALFYELTDEQLEKVRNNKDFYFDNDFLKECNYAKGNNAFFYCLCSNGEQEFINKYLKLLLKEYKTVSWWDRKIEKFKLTKGG